MFGYCNTMRFCVDQGAVGDPMALKMGSADKHYRDRKEPQEQ